eukprot:6478707-Ditylum_brightwellii.AAC.1
MPPDYANTSIFRQQDPGVYTQKHSYKKHRPRDTASLYHSEPPQVPRRILPVGLNYSIQSRLRTIWVKLYHPTIYQQHFVAKLIYEYLQCTGKKFTATAVKLCPVCMP